MKSHPPNHTIWGGNLMNILSIADTNTRASTASDHCSNDAGTGTEGANALNIVEGQRSHA